MTTTIKTDWDALEVTFESLAAVNPPCPPAPAWADHTIEAAWESASEDTLFGSYERTIGEAGNRAEGVTVSVWQEVRTKDGVVGLGPVTAHLSGGLLHGEMDMRARDLRALAGLLLSAADVADRIE